MDNTSDPLNQALNDLLSQLNHLNLSPTQTNLSDLNQINNLQNSPLDPTKSFNCVDQLNRLNQELNPSLNPLNTFSNFDHSLLNDPLATNLDHHTRKMVLHCDDDQVKTYTTINDHGYIYKHTYDGHEYRAGEVRGRSIYNDSGVYLGYGGQDGYIYHKGNYDDYKVGYVDDNGHIFRYDHDKLYDTNHITSKGIIGGAAYMLIVEYGGVN